SSEVDARGVDLVRRWIASLPAEASPPPETANDGPRVEHLTAKLTPQSADPAARKAVVDEFLGSTEGALALAGLVAELPPGAAREAIVDHASQHADPQVRDLFERFLPDAKRTQRIAAVVTPGDILSRTGDI